MASYFSSFLPQSVQKRLLRYVITTYTPLLDPTTLDLDKLDFQIGRRTVLSLTDVGIDGSKLHPMLHLPPDITIPTATITNLTIVLPADLHRSGIEVTIDGVRCVISVSLPSGEPAEDVKPNKQDRGKRKSRERKDINASVLLSPEEVAREFVKTQPKKEKRRLQKSALAFGNASGFWRDGFESESDLEGPFHESEEEDETDDEENRELSPRNDSPHLSVQQSIRRLSSNSSNSRKTEESSGGDDEDSSDDEGSDTELGTGTSLALPAFLASFIKGIGDRLQLRVRDVNITMEIPKSGLLPQPASSFTEHGVEDMMTLEVVVDGVDIEGVTTSLPSSVDATVSMGSGQVRIGKRKIKLNRLNTFLVGEESLFDDPKHPTSNVKEQYEQEDLGGTEVFDGTIDRSMQGSVCTVKDLGNSVDTLRGPSPPRSEIATLEMVDETSDYTDEDKSYSRPDSVIAEEERLSKSVASLGSGSDACSEATDDMLSESQMFADYEDDQGELPFSIHQLNKSTEAPIDAQEVHSPPTTASSPTPTMPLGQHQSFPTLPSSHLPLPQAPVHQSSPALLPVPRISIEPGQNTIQYTQSPSASGIQHIQSPLASEDGYQSDASSTSADEAARRTLSESMVFSREEADSLYFSVASGIEGAGTARGFSRNLSHNTGLDGAAERKAKEEITHEEIEERLGRLMGPGQFQSIREENEVMESSIHGDEGHPESRRVRKRLAELDYVEVFVPAIAGPETSPTTKIEPPKSPEPHERSTVDESHPHLPGSFSSYAASRSGIEFTPGSPPKSQLRRSPLSSPDNKRERERPSTPKGQGVKFAEDLGTSPSRRARESRNDAPTIIKEAEVEIFVGKVHLKVDIIVGGFLTKLFGIFGEIMVTVNEGSPAEEPKQPGSNDNRNTSNKDRNEVENKLEVIVGEIDCKLVDTLGGILIAGTKDGVPERERQNFAEMEDEMILGILVQGTKIGFSSQIPLPSSSMAGEVVASTRISVTKFTINDCHDPLIHFVSELPPSLNLNSQGKPKKRRTSSAEKLAAMQDDIVVNITTAGNKKKAVIETLPLKVECQLQRLEDLFGWFGGFGSVLGLGSTTASGLSTPVVGRGRKNVSWKEDREQRLLPKQQTNLSNTPPPAEGETKIEAKFGGLIVDVVGKNGAVGLRTSVIKLRKKDASGIVFGIEKIVILGPDLVDQIHTADARVIIESTRLEFASSPNDEDLARLLRLLTPSKDKFAQDDDIILDTLFEQRRQGSVLRVSVDRIHSEVDDLKECERFIELGEEVAKVLTVTNYIAQDERPGILTLLYVGGVDVAVELGILQGNIQLNLLDLEVSQVSAPSLLALAVGTVGLRRNGDEELVGEGLPRSAFSNSAKGNGADEDRPMVMVRMVGDEMEPVIKVKLWNLRFEYNVNTLLALANIENTATEAIAKDMVDSITSIATITQKTGNGQGGKQKEAPLHRTDSNLANKPLAIDIVIRDSVLGLNPLILPSRGLLILTDSRIFVEMPSAIAALETTIDLKRASIFIVDDTANLLGPEEASSYTRRRKEALSEHLAVFTAMGYVSIASISSAKAVMKLVESDVPGEKCIDLEVYDDLFLLETCADSTQTLLGIVNGLKPPLPEGEEVKYCTQVMPLDIFASMCEDAFVHPSKRKGGNTNAPLSMNLAPVSESEQEEDADMVGDDVPMNLTFVESYYGHRDTNYSEETLAESMLEDDLTHIAQPTRPLEIGEKGVMATFTEQVHMLDNAPIEIMDNHFATSSKKKDTSLIATASQNAHGAPLKVKIRDVHFIWNLHDGYDWSKTRDTISKAVKRVEYRASERYRNRAERRVSYDMEEDEESAIGDFLFNSIYIGIPANRDPKELARQINTNFDADYMSETGSYASTGLESRPSSRSRSSTDPSKRRLRLNRSRAHKMQIELKGVSVDFVLYPPDSGETQSSVDLRIRDLEIIDNVPTSTWKKFVTYMQDAGKRETGSQMAHIEILNVKPIPTLAASELVVKATILPLRLHVDQDTLDFMTRFFEFKDESVVAATVPGDIPFLQRIEVNSVRVKLDYKPKKVDYAGLRSGHTTEFMNFFILEEADMVMRHVVLHGISGFPRLSKELNNTWMPDIQRTQLGGVLAGVAPVRSLVNLGSGVKDLVVVPMREYKKDGRIVRSLQKGAYTFARTTTSELVRLGAKMAVGAQGWLENTEEFLGGAGSAGRGEGTGVMVYHQEGSEDEEEGPKLISLYADQPKNVVQGLRGASASLKRNFNTARDAMRAVPEDISQRGSAAGVAQAVARAAPIMLLRPAIGATEAISRTLLGVNNHLDPDNQRKVDDKYKKH